MKDSSKSHTPPVVAMDVDFWTGSTYPPPLDASTAERKKRALGNAFGLDQFGVNHVFLTSGTESSLRHWHATEDEFVYVLKGTVTLLTEDSEYELHAGMCAGFKAGCDDGHQFVNRSDGDVELLEVGSRNPTDAVFYPDDDLMWLFEPDGKVAIRKSGERY